MKKNKKKILIFILIIWLLITLYIIQTTYAKYYSKIDGNTNISVSSWNIKVNDNDITHNNSFDSPVDLNFDINEYVSEGIIVPGSSGYFDLIIDSTPVTIPFSYTVAIENSLENSLVDLVLSRLFIRCRYNNCRFNF